MSTIPEENDLTLVLWDSERLILEGVVAFDLLVQVIIDHDKLTQPCVHAYNRILKPTKPCTSSVAYESDNHVTAMKRLVLNHWFIHQ